MFMELHSGTDGETTLPACLLHKVCFQEVDISNLVLYCQMVYMHRREKFLHRNKPCPPGNELCALI